MRADKKKIEEAMARTCMTRQDIAKAAHMPLSTTSKVLNGHSVRPATLGRVARALGVDSFTVLAKDGWDN